MSTNPLNYAPLPPRLPLPARLTFSAFLLLTCSLALFLLWGPGAMGIACFDNPPFYFYHYGLFNYLYATQMMEYPHNMFYALHFPQFLLTLFASLTLLTPTLYFTHRLLRRHK